MRSRVTLVRVRERGKPPTPPRVRVRVRRTVDQEIAFLKDREWEHGETHTARIAALIEARKEGLEYLD